MALLSQERPEKPTITGLQTEPELGLTGFQSSPPLSKWVFGPFLQKSLNWGSQRIPAVTVKSLCFLCPQEPSKFLLLEGASSDPPSEEEDRSRVDLHCLASLQSLHQEPVPIQVLASLLFLCYLLIFCGASSDINIFMFSHMERGREKGARENGGGGREGEGRGGQKRGG